MINKRCMPFVMIGALLTSSSLQALDPDVVYCAKKEIQIMWYLAETASGGFVGYKLLCELIKWDNIDCYDMTPAIVTLSCVGHGLIGLHKEIKEYKIVQMMKSLFKNYGLKFIK